MRIAIVGAGDLGQLIARHAPNCGYSVAGFFDDTREPGTSTPLGSVLGPLAALDDEVPGARVDGLAMGIGYRHMAFRASAFDRLSTRFRFPPIVHPSCTVDASANVGDGAFLLPGCVIDAGVSIGRNVLLNTACVIAHDTTVEDGSFFGPGVMLAGFVVVRRGVFLGVGTVVIDNVTIGSGVRTGGGAVVVEDLLTPGLYLGVPARRVERESP